MFSSPMVRALLDGSKTQTRRIYKNRKHPDAGCDMAGCELVREPQHVIDRICPYGTVGDRLWVRETFNGPMWFGEDEPKDSHTPKYCHYAATEPGPPEYMDADDNLVCRWKPSIHMPRWASRITLEIVSVHVERLQDISQDDARAEGITDGGCINCGDPEPCKCTMPMPDARESYCHLWGRINGPDSWLKNPWVWCVEFKRITP